MAAIDFLPNEVASFCRNQIDSRFRIDRSNPRMNVIAVGQFPSALKIPLPSFEDALFRVRLTVNGRRETANVTFYKGFVFSVETKQYRKFYKDKEVEVTDVAEGKPKQSITRAIDRREHGSNQT
jgi:hypothetical protein